MLPIVRRQWQHNLGGSVEKRRHWSARWSVLAVVLVLLLGGRAALAGPVLALDAAAGELALDGHGQAWLDADGHADLASVAAGTAGAWVATVPGHIYPLRRGQALWFRFTLSEADDNERWYLQVPYPGVDRVTLSTQDPQGRWIEQTAGDTLAVAAWPLPHRHPLLPLALMPGTPQQFYLRVENRNGFGAPLQFTSERELVRQEQRSGLVLGIYFGLAGLSIVLALLAALPLRDAAFAWYALTIGLMALSQACLTGIAGLHLWPRQAWWNDVSAIALPPAAVAALLWFLSTVVSLPERSRRSHLLLAVLSVACLAAAGAILLVDPGWRSRILVPVMVLSILAAISVVAWAASRGDRHAGWLLVAMVPVAVGASLPLARLSGWLPVSFWTTHAMQIGIAIDLPLLMAVLVARSQHRRATSRRLHGLDRTDPATGLINAHVFLERLQRLIARSGRLKHDSLVLLVDIANTQALRRDFEPRWADELPLRVAGRLQSAAREFDSVARLADHRFGMLVEGPLTVDEVAATGPKIVARCLMPFKDRPLEWVAQVRVAHTLVPSGHDARSVVERLDAVLAAVPPDSKRAVFPVR
nr:MULTISPECIES: 7TM diverse intracellular signaling domain-containing protein [Ramlibacter]